MKNLFIISIVCFILFSNEYAIGINHAQYYDKGLIYSGTTFPNSVAKSKNIPDKTAIENFRYLKSGESTSNNILFFVEVGDAGIDKATKNGGINKISYIDVNEKTIFIFWRKVTVNVYGE